MALLEQVQGPCQVQGLRWVQEPDREEVPALHRALFPNLESCQATVMGSKIREGEPCQDEELVSLRELALVLAVMVLVFLQEPEPAFLRDLALVPVAAMVLLEEGLV